MGIIGGADGSAAIFLGSGILKDIQLSPALLIALLTVLCLVAYFLGNISPSTILAKKQGLDIKKEGSGNAGTTNALRVMGNKAGAITLVIDIIKGIVATLLGELLLGAVGAACCALMVVLGHVWPIVYKFKGGKGVATVFGALLAINPLMAVICLLVVAIFVFTTKRMSVGSVAGAILVPIISFVMEPVFFPEALVMAIIVLIKHRANIRRIIHGEEPIMSIFEKKKDKTEGGNA
ncbi:MAG: glycerol-3-phosphate 1-O-acyltransferase PlsY [Firmicutes bacterium]|nr:glycerol-3-phosphate 1-O-acyltransferase PlsY [Bacillota bacterium]